METVWLKFKAMGNFNNGLQLIIGFIRQKLVPHTFQPDFVFLIVREEEKKEKKKKRSN